MGQGRGRIMGGGSEWWQWTNELVAKQHGVCVVPPPSRQGDLQYDVGVVVTDATDTTVRQSLLHRRCLQQYCRRMGT